MSKALGLIETRGLVAAIVAADTMLKTADVKLGKKELADAGLVTITIFGDTASVKIAVEAAAEAAAKVGELVSAHVIPRPDDELSVILPGISENEIPDPAKQEIVAPVIKEQKEKEPVEKPVKVEKKKPVEKPVRVVESKAVEKPVKSEKAAPVEKPVEPEKSKPPVKIKAADKKPEPEKKAKEPVKPVVKEDAQVSLFDIPNETITRLREEALIEEKTEADEPADENIPVEKDLTEKAGNVSGNEIAGINLDDMDVHKLRRLARSTEGFPIQGRQISKANRKQLIDYFKSLV